MDQHLIPLGFDAVLAAMLRDCAFVGMLGTVIDLSEPSHYRKQRTISSYRGYYAPAARRIYGPRGGVRYEHVVDAWLRHPERKTVDDGDADYPLTRSQRHQAERAALRDRRQ